MYKTKGLSISGRPFYCETKSYLLSYYSVMGASFTVK